MQCIEKEYELDGGDGKLAMTPAGTKPLIDRHVENRKEGGVDTWG